MDSVSEKISRILDRIAMVGLILSIIKIPAFKKDSRFRSGQLSNQVNLFMEDDWLHAYERRMRRFNLMVIVSAVIAFVILILSWPFVQ